MKQNIIDDYNLLTGQQKAAILMLSLNEERSSSLFSLMDDEEIKELSVVMAGLGKVNSGVVEQLFDEFVERASNSGMLIGTYESTERLLSKALDKDRVSVIMKKSEVRPVVQCGINWAMLMNMFWQTISRMNTRKQLPLSCQR